MVTIAGGATAGISGRAGAGISSRPSGRAG